MYKVKTIIRSHKNAQEMAYKLTSSQLAEAVSINKVMPVYGEKDCTDTADVFGLDISTIYPNETIQLLEDSNAYRRTEILVEDILHT